MNRRHPRLRPLRHASPKATAWIPAQSPLLGGAYQEIAHAEEALTSALSQQLGTSTTDHQNRTSATGFHGLAHLTVRQADRSSVERHNMYLRDFGRALVRRWYLVIVGILLAGLSCFFVWSQVGARYTAENSTLMLPPLSATKGTAPKGRDGNPLLYLGGLGQARDVVIGAVNAASVRTDHENRFPSAEYVVAADTLSSGPIVVVRSTASSPEVALGSAEFMTERLQVELDRMQAELEVGKDSKIRLMALTADTAPKADNQLRIRVAVVVGAALVLGALFLIGLMDGLVLSRRRGRHTHTDPAAAPKRRARVADGQSSPDTGGDRRQQSDSGSTSEQTAVAESTIATDSTAEITATH